MSKEHPGRLRRAGKKVAEWVVEFVGGMFS